MSEKIETRGKLSVSRGALMLAAMSFFLLYFGCVYADLIHLKNGKTLEGEILEKTDASVVLRIKLGKITVNSSEIDSIEVKALPEDFSKKEAAPKVKEPEKVPVAAQQEVTINQKEEAAPAAEAKKDKEKEEKPLYAISLKADYRSSPPNEYVDTEGTTNLPDGSLIYIFFKRFDSYISTAKVIAKDGRFSMMFGPFRKQLFGGTYNVEADFMLDKQSEDITKKIRKGKDNKKPKLIHGAYSLIIEKPESPNLNEKQVRAELESIAFGLKGLYDELEKTYNADKGKFDANEWNRWSEDWILRTKKEKAKIAQYSQGGFSLFSQAENRLAAAAGMLLNLHMVRSMELKNLKRTVNKTEGSYPGYIVGPDEMKNIFEEALKHALKEIGSGR